MPRIYVSDMTQPTEGPVYVSGDYDMSGLIHRIEHALRDGEVEVFVLDSATALFSHSASTGHLRAASG